MTCFPLYWSYYTPWTHYNDVIMSAMASQIPSLTIVYSTIYSGADQRKHQSSASLAFVWGSHPWPVNSPHKGPVTRKMFPFDDVIICRLDEILCRLDEILCRLDDLIFKYACPFSASVLRWLSVSKCCSQHCGWWWPSNRAPGTNFDPFHRRLYAALGGDELIYNITKDSDISRLNFDQGSKSLHAAGIHVQRVWLKTETLGLHKIPYNYMWVTTEICNADP